MNFDKLDHCQFVDNKWVKTNVVQGVKFFSKNRAVKIIQKPTVNKSIKSKQRISERKKKKLSGFAYGYFCYFIKCLTYPN